MTGPALSSDLFKIWRLSNCGKLECTMGFCYNVCTLSTVYTV